MEKLKKKKNGFTLVELLAVIVILAIILVIAVPQIMSVIEDAKKATLESTAKMIASQAEKAKVQNTVLGKEQEITCESIAKINNTDYASCDITFENNTAKVTIEGSGKFDGFWVCNGTKTEATAMTEGCGVVCAVDEQKEIHNYVHPYEVNDISSCGTYVTEKFVNLGMATEEQVASVVQLLCNGGTLEGGDFNYFIKEFMRQGVFTEEELVEANVIKPKEIEEVELCMPKKPIKLSTYITKVLKNDKFSINGLAQTDAEYNGTTYDAGIRYVGAMDEVKNKVYYNCDDTDTNGVAYGEENYDYPSSCEVWRIIGVFDTKSSTSGSAEKRIKLINVSSTFSASWDSSASDINNGFGINQWGESTLIDGSVYKGADLMQLLNGYYIGKEEATCTYCNGGSQEICNQTCTAESLKSANMKVLTNGALGMIENAVWDTYGVMYPEDEVTNTSFASSAYLEEKGISEQYIGKICTSGDGCNDKVERTTSWTGLVGLMSVSDVLYANGWLYSQEGSELISPYAYSGDAYNVCGAYGSFAGYGSASLQNGVFPSVYLKSDIQIIGGDGYEEPYKLK